NASGVATDVAMSGDATISNTGALTLNTVPVSKGGTGVTSYALGQVPVSDGVKLTATGCALGQTLVWTASGFACGMQSASGSSLAPANIWVGNSSSIATAVAPTGDVSLSNAGAFKVTALQNVAVSATAPTNSQVLQFNGTNWSASTLNFMSPTLTQNNVWLGNSSNIASPIAVPTCAANNYLTFNGTSFSCALDAGSTGSVTSIATTSPLATTGATGNVTLSMNLNAGHIYVGNASNLATDVTMSGDTSISNTGAVTVNKIQNSTVTISAPSANQILQYNGSAWLNVTPTYQSSTLNDAKIWVGNSSNLAAPVSMTG